MKSTHNPGNESSESQHSRIEIGAPSESNFDCVGRSLQHLKDGIIPLVRPKLAHAEKRGVLKENWTQEFDRLDDRDAELLHSKSYEKWDVPSIVNIINRSWSEVFRFALKHEARTLLFEARNA